MMREMSHKPHQSPPVHRESDTFPRRACGGDGSGAAGLVLVDDEQAMTRPAVKLPWEVEP
jgi:hypothetical protein